MPRLSRAALVALIVGFAVIAASLASGRLGGWLPGPDLPAIERDVAKRWPEVTPIARARLVERLAGGGDIVLLDVREADEHRVSRLAGAERVDPEVGPEALVAALGDKIAGKTVVLYCAVGVRSARLAARAQQALKARGAAAVLNLEGGIFGWHNDGRPLVDAKGSTDVVHGYDSRWGRLVARSRLVRDQPLER